MIHPGVSVDGSSSKPSITENSRRSATTLLLRSNHGCHVGTVHDLLLFSISMKQ